MGDLKQYQRVGYAGLGRCPRDYRPTPAGAGSLFTVAITTVFALLKPLHRSLTYLATKRSRFVLTWSEDGRKLYSCCHRKPTFCERSRHVDGRLLAARSCPIGRRSKPSSGSVALQSSQEFIFVVNEVVYRQNRTPNQKYHVKDYSRLFVSVVSETQLSKVKVVLTSGREYDN